MTFHDIVPDRRPDRAKQPALREVEGPGAPGSIRHARDRSPAPGFLRSATLQAVPAGMTEKGEERNIMTFHDTARQPVPPGGRKKEKNRNDPTFFAKQTDLSRPARRSAGRTDRDGP